MITDHLYFMAEKEPHSEVRSSAILLLGDIGVDNEKALDIAKKALSAKAYNVQSAGLQTTYRLDSEEGLKAAMSLEDEEMSDIIMGVSTIYAAEADAKFLPYFTKNLHNVDGYASFDFYENYVNMIAQLDIKHLSGAVENLKNIGIDMGQSPWKRMASMQGLSSLNTTFTEKGGDDTSSDMYPFIEKINAAIASLKAKETNPQLKAIYENY